MEGNYVQHLVENLPRKVEADQEEQLPVNAKDFKLNFKQAHASVGVHILLVSGFIYICLH